MYQKIAFLQMDFICELAEVKVKPRRLHVVPWRSLIQPNPAEHNFAHRTAEVTYGTFIMDPGGPPGSWTGI